MEKITLMDVEMWAARSRQGEVCGIFGCQEKPVVKCDHCSNMYCNLHAGIIDMPCHKEPDREEFEYNGYKCLIQRHLEMGHLCGYVGVSKGHPCYGRIYEPMIYDDIYKIQIHGGLTHSGEGDGGNWPKGYWWFGFDCAHAWDLVPNLQMLSKHMGFRMDVLDGIYRDFEYVRKETKSLVEQIMTIDFIDWEFTWVWPLLLPASVVRRIWDSRG